jgi:hypothetical protein
MFYLSLISFQGLRGEFVVITRLINSEKMKKSTVQ